MSAVDGNLDEYFMQAALALAGRAQVLGEVPVGAVVVRSGEIIGQGFNSPIANHDPSAHAEIMAIRDAAQREHNYRLPNSTLYVTLEPCTMCIGALIHARIERLVFATREPKSGAVISQIQLLGSDVYNHSVSFTEGVLADQSSALLSAFFQTRRTAKKNQRLADNAL